LSIYRASTFTEDHGHHPEISNTQALAGDIEKASLNVSVAEEERDVLRFLWFDDVKKGYPEVTVLRFARVVIKPISPKCNCETPRGRI